MKRIAVVTATRAEYGLLMPVIRKLRKLENDLFHVDLIVTGTHLSHDYGYTVDEIKADGIRIDRMEPVSLSSESEMAISANQADVLLKFTEIFSAEKYAGIVILGDRYEMLAVAIAAANTRTQIFHLCGGDTTEGAMDEWIRHSITKMSYLHFPTNEQSRRRIIQMGEAPDRVFNYGSTSIDNIMGMDLLSKDEVFNSLRIKPCRYALCTYHPVTMEDNPIESQICQFLSAIKQFKDIEFIITKSNADRGGAAINRLLEDAVSEISNIHLYSSLGAKLYLSAMRCASFVIGNSSSGIIETPSFCIPTINIGSRQRGRLQAGSVINCSDDKESIVSAIQRALSDEFIERCKLVINVYGQGNAAIRIAKMIYDVVINQDIDLMKKFYDMQRNELV